MTIMEEHHAVRVLIESATPIFWAVIPESEANRNFLRSCLAIKPTQKLQKAQDPS